MRARCAAARPQARRSPARGRGAARGWAPGVARPALAAVVALLLLLRPPGAARAQPSGLGRGLEQDSGSDGTDDSSEDSSTNWWNSLAEFTAGDANELYEILADNQGLDMVICLTGNASATSSSWPSTAWIIPGQRVVIQSWLASTPSGYTNSSLLSSGAAVLDFGGLEGVFRVAPDGLLVFRRIVLVGVASSREWAAERPEGLIPWRMPLFPTVLTEGGSTLGLAYVCFEYLLRSCDVGYLHLMATTVSAASGNAWVIQDGVLLSSATSTVHLPLLYYNGTSANATMVHDQWGWNLDEGWGLDDDGQTGDDDDDDDDGKSPDAQASPTAPTAPASPPPPPPPPASPASPPASPSSSASSPSPTEADAGDMYTVPGVEMVPDSSLASWIVNGSVSGSAGNDQGDAADAPTTAQAPEEQETAEAQEERGTAPASENQGTATAPSPSATAPSPEAPPPAARRRALLVEARGAPDAGARAAPPPASAALAYRRAAPRAAGRAGPGERVAILGVEGDDEDILREVGERWKKGVEARRRARRQAERRDPAADGRAELRPHARQTHEPPRFPHPPPASSGHQRPRPGADAAAEGGDAAADAPRRGGDATPDAPRRGGDATPDAPRRGGDAAADALRGARTDASALRRDSVKASGGALLARALRQSSESAPPAAEGDGPSPPPPTAPSLESFAFPPAPTELDLLRALSPLPFALVQVSRDGQPPVLLPDWLARANGLVDAPAPEAERGSEDGDEAESPPVSSLVVSLFDSDAAASPTAVVTDALSPAALASAPDAWSPASPSPDALSPASPSAARFPAALSPEASSSTSAVLSSSSAAPGPDAPAPAPAPAPAVRAPLSELLPPSQLSALNAYFASNTSPTSSINIDDVISLVGQPLEAPSLKFNASSPSTSPLTPAPTPSSAAPGAPAPSPSSALAYSTPAAEIDLSYEDQTTVALIVSSISAGCLVDPYVLSPSPSPATPPPPPPPPDGTGGNAAGTPADFPDGTDAGTEDSGDDAVPAWAWVILALGIAALCTGAAVIGLVVAGRRKRRSRVGPGGGPGTDAPGPLAQGCPDARAPGVGGYPLARDADGDSGDPLVAGLEASTLEGLGRNGKDDKPADVADVEAGRRGPPRSSVAIRNSVSLRGSDATQTSFSSGRTVAGVGAKGAGLGAAAGEATERAIRKAADSGAVAGTSGDSLADRDSGTPLIRPLTASSSSSASSVHGGLGGAAAPGRAEGDGEATDAAASRSSSEDRPSLAAPESAAAGAGMLPPTGYAASAASLPPGAVASAASLPPGAVASAASLPPGAPAASAAAPQSAPPSRWSSASPASSATFSPPPLPPPGASLPAAPGRRPSASSASGGAFGAAGDAAGGLPWAAEPSALPVPTRVLARTTHSTVYLARWRGADVSYKAVITEMADATMLAMTSMVVALRHPHLAITYVLNILPHGSALGLPVATDHNVAVQTLRAGLVVVAAGSSARRQRDRREKRQRRAARRARADQGDHGADSASAAPPPRSQDDPPFASDDDGYGSDSSVSSTSSESSVSSLSSIASLSPTPLLPPPRGAAEAVVEAVAAAEPPIAVEDRTLSAPESASSAFFASAATPLAADASAARLPPPSSRGGSGEAAPTGAQAAGGSSTTPPSRSSSLSASLAPSALATRESSGWAPSTAADSSSRSGSGSGPGGAPADAAGPRSGSGSGPGGAPADAAGPRSGSGPGPGGAPADATGPSLRPVALPRSRRRSAFERGWDATPELLFEAWRESGSAQRWLSLVLVELCDRGSLMDAASRGPRGSAGTADVLGTGGGQLAHTERLGVDPRAEGPGLEDAPERALAERDADGGNAEPSARAKATDGDEARTGAPSASLAGVGRAVSSRSPPSGAPSAIPSPSLALRPASSSSPASSVSSSSSSGASPLLGGTLYASRRLGPLHPSRGPADLQFDFAVPTTLPPPPGSPRFASRRFGMDDALALLRAVADVASALQYLHEVDVVHGNVHPGNVLFKSVSTTRRGHMAKLTGLRKVPADTLPNSRRRVMAAIANEHERAQRRERKRAKREEEKRKRARERMGAGGREEGREEPEEATSAGGREEGREEPEGATSAGGREEGREEPEGATSAGGREERQEEPEEATSAGDPGLSPGWQRRAGADAAGEPDEASLTRLSPSASTSTGVEPSVAASVPAAPAAAGGREGGAPSSTPSPAAPSGSASAVPSSQRASASPSPAPPAAPSASPVPPLPRLSAPPPRSSPRPSPSPAPSSSTPPSAGSSPAGFASARASRAEVSSSPSRAPAALGPSGRLTPRQLARNAVSIGSMARRGQLGFLAPELFQGQPASEPSDTYAVGMLLAFPWMHDWAPGPIDADEDEEAGEGSEATPASPGPPPPTGASLAGAAARGPAYLRTLSALLTPEPPASVLEGAEAPPAGLERLATFARRVVAGERPRLPSWLPASYRALVRDCWQDDFEARPSSGELVARIRACISEVVATKRAAAGGGKAGHGGRGRGRGPGGPRGGGA